MTRDELISRIQAIGSCEDDAGRRELLTQLEEECSADYENFSNLEATNNQLTQDNENLRSANMKLFLRIGDSKKPDDVGGDEPPKEMKFEDLFNEKGELK